MYKRQAAKIRDAAAELLDIYARRAAREGHAFRVDDQQVLSLIHISEPTRPY